MQFEVQVVLESKLSNMQDNTVTEIDPSKSVFYFDNKAIISIFAYYIV